MERFLNFETRQRFQVNLDTGAITVEPSKIVPIPAEEVKTPKQEVSEDTDWMGFEGPLRAGLFRRSITRDTPELPEVKFNFNLPINDQEEFGDGQFPNGDDILLVVKNKTVTTIL